MRELRNFIQEPRKLSDINQVGHKLAGLIENAMQSSSCHLLVPITSERFEVVSTTQEETFQVSLSMNSSLMRWLRDNKTILHQQDMYAIPQLQYFVSTKLEALKVVKPELFVPLVTMGQGIIGLIILGEKSSKQLYSREDENILMTVASRVAIELDNARLHQETGRTALALSESEEKLRRIFESVTDAMVVTDLKSNILDCNEGACKAVRCASKDEILGRNMVDFIAPFEYDRIGAETQSIFEEGTLKNLEGTARRVDGTEFPIEAGASVLRGDTGIPIGFVVIVRDITERKQMEKKSREYEQKAHAASRLATVGEMAAGIAHEINNPLTAVVGFAELLLQEDVPDAVRKNLEIIRDGSQRAAEVVNRLLTFARQHKPLRELVDINDIIRTTYELQRYHMNTTNIKVTMEFDPNLPATAADDRQLQQVFLNLILNAETAIKLAQDGGNLIIRTETVNGFIRISFADDGPGIAEENMQRLFEPFFTTREVGQGTGLGLSICYGIIKEHEGTIHAESKEGEGATFIIELPIITF
ncbi:ATP-binding protein [Chloroflexota bacterium]